MRSVGEKGEFLPDALRDPTPVPPLLLEASTPLLGHQCISPPLLGGHRDGLNVPTVGGVGGRLVPVKPPMDQA